MTTDQPTAARTLSPAVPLAVAHEVVRVVGRLQRTATARGHRAHEKLAAFVIVDAAAGSVRAILHDRGTIRASSRFSGELARALDIADPPGELRLFVRYADRADGAEETVLLSEWCRRFGCTNRERS